MARTELPSYTLKIAQNCHRLNSWYQMARSLDLSVFRQRGWLAGAPPGFREAMLSRCDLLSVPAGKALYQAGDEPGGLYGLLEGRVEVHLVPRGETPTMIQIAGPGFWTGEFSATTGGRRLIALIARNDCRVLRLSRAELHRLAETAPECWQMLARLAAWNNSAVLDVIGMLKREDACERVAMMLLILSREVPDAPVLLDVSQTELGHLARMSRGTVNTALRRLAGEGLIAQEYGAIRVPDLAALERFEA